MPDVREFRDRLVTCCQCRQWTQDPCKFRRKPRGPRRRHRTAGGAPDPAIASVTGKSFEAKVFGSFICGPDKPEGFISGNLWSKRHASTAPVRSPITIPEITRTYDLLIIVHCIREVVQKSCTVLSMGKQVGKPRLLASQLIWRPASSWELSAPPSPWYCTFYYQSSQR